MKHCTIPESWHGEEALAVVAFLDQLSQAIWRAHGGEMARCLELRHSCRERPPSGWLAVSDPPRRLSYEPIPFPGGSKL